MIWYIFLGIILFISFAIIIPLKIHIKYKADSTGNDNGNVSYENYITVYIFGFIKIFKKSFDKKNIKNSNMKSENKESNSNDSENNSNDENKVVNTVYNLLINFLDYSKMAARLINEKDFIKINNSFKFKNVKLKLGINFKNMMLNIYMLTLISTVISAYIAKNINKFNPKKLNYSVNISEKIIDLDVDCILKFKLANTIGIILKIIFKLRKVEDKNVRTTTSSNRKFNDDSYDIYRKYDRC